MSKKIDDPLVAATARILSENAWSGSKGKLQEMADDLEAMASDLEYNFVSGPTRSATRRTSAKELTKKLLEARRILESLASSSFYMDLLDTEL